MKKEVEERFEYGVSKVTSVGSVVIPARIRKAEGIKPGDTVAVVDIDGKVFIQKPAPKNLIGRAFQTRG